MTTRGEMRCVIECADSYFVKDGGAFVLRKFKIRLGWWNFDGFTTPLAE